MHKHFFKYRREFVEGVVIYLLLQLSQLPSIASQSVYYIALTILGLVYIIAISFITYLHYSKRKVSKFSDTLMKLQIKNRVGVYLLMPLVLFTSSMVFLYYNQNPLLKEIMVLITSILLLVNLINIRISYEQSHVIQRSTLVVFNFIDILTYYFIASICYYIIDDYVIRGLILSIATVLILGYMAKLHNEFNLIGLAIVLISSVFVFGISMLTSELNLFRYPLVQTIFFYMLISFWHLRLSGHLKLNDYINPMLFTSMSLIVIFGI